MSLNGLSVFTKKSKKRNICESTKRTPCYDHSITVNKWGNRNTHTIKLAASQNTKKSTRNLGGVCKKWSFCDFRYIVYNRRANVTEYIKAIVIFATIYSCGQPTTNQPTNQPCMASNAGTLYHSNVV